MNETIQSSHWIKFWVLNAYNALLMQRLSKRRQVSWFWHLPEAFRKLKNGLFSQTCLRIHLSCCTQVWNVMFRHLWRPFSHRSCDLHNWSWTREGNGYGLIKVSMWWIFRCRRCIWNSTMLTYAQESKSKNLIMVLIQPMESRFEGAIAQCDERNQDFEMRPSLDRCICQHDSRKSKWNIQKTWLNEMESKLKTLC